MVLQHLTAIQHHFLSHIFPNVPSPTGLISNTNWLLLLWLIISAVKHNFSSPSFSRHYSPPSHLSTCFPWLSSFSTFYFQPQAFSLYLTSFSPRLHFLMNSKLSRRTSSSLLLPKFLFAPCLSFFFCSFMSRLLFPVHLFSLPDWLSLLAWSRWDQREGKMEKSKLNPHAYISPTLSALHLSCN